MKKFNKSLFLFSRDLRIDDNTGLINACSQSEQVIPCFIFEKSLAGKTNSINSNFRNQFFLESVEDLTEQFKAKNSKLFIFYGDTKKILSTLIHDFQIDAIFSNIDYSPYAIKKLSMLKSIGESYNVPTVFSHDLVLHDFDLIKTGKGTPYVIFSQFFKKAKNFPIRKPQKNNFTNFLSVPFKDEKSLGNITKILGIKLTNRPRVKGGRKNALQILKSIHNQKNYDEQRNFPSLDSTSHLSAHNKFGTCSIREVYHQIEKQLGPNHGLITEIHWRDFFTYVMYHYPYSYSKSFRKKFSKIPWSKNEKLFSKWCDGLTGFPIVDAGMRELNSTGYMHNRIRMIVASFLTKDLHINWKWGERYFAKKLIDFDPCVNVGNWQWAASTGCDSQPWFRIFNPWLQQEKYDPNCEYIKKWIPELSDFSIKQIHKWYSYEGESKYPRPIVDHSEESSHTKEIFQKISSQSL